MWRDDAALLDILEAAKALHRICGNTDYESFRSTEDARRLVERYFEIIGEASARLSEQFRETHAEIPWSAWIGLRNVVSHQYHKVDYARLWELMQVAVPALIKYLTPFAPPTQA